MNNVKPSVKKAKRFGGSFDVAATVKKAVMLHQAGRFADAEKIYRQVLKAQPDNFDCLHLLGVIHYQRGNHAAAVSQIDAALRVQPNVSDAFNNRGNALRGLNRLDEALASFDRAIALDPGFAESFFNRGVVLQEMNRLDEALASYDRAIALNALHAKAFNNRGNVLKEMKRLDEALASYDRAIALRPDYAEAFNNRGNALKGLMRLDEALASFDHAIALKPGFAEAFNNRGIALEEVNRREEALASYDQAITLNSRYAEAFHNRGNVLKELKRLDKALASHDRAIALKTGYAGAFYSRGMVRLLDGRYGTAWLDYEWRWSVKEFPSRPPKIDAPVWQGEDLTGRRIVVYAEQGMGDVIQFTRYLPLLVRRGAAVTFFSPAGLVRLLRPLDAAIEIISTIDGSEAFDFQCALMSLPHRFGTELSSIPDRIPYLAAEDDLIARWKPLIGEHGFKIGIAWQGNPKGKIDQGRSIPLSEYVPLSGVPGVRLISLQKTHGLDQLATLPQGTVETLGDDFDTGPDAFVDTAAVIAHLDLIITSDTSIAHLAGALGRPTWVALKHVPDWRWLLGREDSPWYPTMRLFRQQTDGDWKLVFAKIAQELGLLAGTAGHPLSADGGQPPSSELPT